MSKNNNDVKSNSILVKTLKFGVYLIAFIPLVIFEQYLSPFHFGKVIVLRSIVEVLAVLYIVLLLSPGGKNYLPPKSKILWAFIIFAGVFGLTTLTGINSYQSFWGNLERMGGWFTFMHYLIFFIIAISMLKTKQDWIRLINISIFVAVLSALYGFLQKTNADWVIGSGGRNKIFGTIGNPALFAGYILVNTFLALSMFFKREFSSRAKQFYFSAFLIGFLAIMLAGVRGSVLGLVVGLAIFGFMNGSAKLRKLAIWFLILVAVTAGSLYSIRNSDFVKSNAYLDRYADISPTTYTVQTRVWAWTAGLDAWNDSAKTILVGYGPDNFNYPFSFKFNPKFYRGAGSETLFDRAHNMFIEVWVTMGLVGLASYILLFIAAFGAVKRIGREDKVFGAGFVALLVAYMIHNSFIFDTSANFIIFFTTLGFISFLDPETKHRQMIESSKSFGSALGFLMIILLLGVALLINVVNIRPVKANYTTTRAIVAGWGNDVPLALEKYKEAMSYEDVPIKYEIRHRYAQYIIGLANKKDALQNKIIVDGLLFSLEEIQKNIDANPHDYLPYLYKARTNIMLGRNNPESPYNDVALEDGLKALEITPTFVRAYFEVAQAYLNKKDYDNAIDYFQRAYDLHPDATISAWYLGMAYVDKGEALKGLKIIEDSGYDAGTQELLKLVDAYIKLNNFNKVAELYERLVEINPTSAQFHASLAVAYVQVGKIDEAVAAATKAAELDPSFTAESQAFIRSLGR